MSILYLHISSPINCLAKYLMGENYQILTEDYVHLYLTTFDYYICTVRKCVSVWSIFYYMNHKGFSYTCKVEWHLSEKKKTMYLSSVS